MANNTLNKQETSIWLRIHRWLLPDDDDVGIMPYVWLGYLSLYFTSFIFIPVSTFQIIASIICISIFLVLYFRAYWAPPRLIYYFIAAIWVIGIYLSYIRMPGASVFIVYASAFCCQLNHIKSAFITLAVLCSCTIATSLMLDISPYIYMPGIFFALLIGINNIYLNEMGKKNQQIKASQEEIKKVAAAAERERIARDLHDLIGHTFSTINVKAQLAKKLISKNTKQAQTEVQEIENVSRKALSQVREAVSGYRKRDVFTELTHTRIILNSIDVEVIEDILPHDSVQLTEVQNTTLAYIVRELTTNIMRHARASQCWISFIKEGDEWALGIRDNGSARSIKEGSGLSGIRERIESLSGSVLFNVESGFSALMKIPAYE